MNELNQRLQETFYFSASDLLANRRGALSDRQKARQRGTQAGLRLSMGLFVFIMLASLAYFILVSFQTGSAPDPASTNEPSPLIMAALLVGAVVVAGVALSLPYMTSATKKTISAAQGKAGQGKIKADAARFELKIGAAKLRLVTQDQLDAFQMGVEYRVYYLPGPVATILSAEVVGSEAEAETAFLAEEAAPVEQDRVLQLQGRARIVLLALGAMIVCVMAAGVAAGLIPESMRWLLWGLAFTAALGFVFWAVIRIRP
jgi:hypothetical protein